MIASPQAPDSLPTVMVIEDDHEIRGALVEILDSEGYRVLAAANGQEGLDMLRNGTPEPSMIILDLMMPIMDGWIFRNHQLQDSKLAKIPVVVITADGNAKTKARAMNAVAGIRKPIDLEELLRTVKITLQAD